MADIVWLASYPKSGNTWVRVLLANYARDGNEPESINTIGTLMRGASARFLFDVHCALKSTSLSSNIVTRLRPEIVRRAARSIKERQFLKVHDAWQTTDRGEPLFPQECTAGVIYIVRNVLDVAASMANHNGTTIQRAVEQLCNRNFVLAPVRKSPSEQVPQFLGDWSHHVTSWIEGSSIGCLVVRYEDLHADTVSALRDMVRMAGWDEDEARLGRATAHSHFEVLRDMERAQGFRERPFPADSFFRRGAVGGWREELTPELARRLIDAHGDVMRRFGYLDAVGQPV